MNERAPGLQGNDEEKERRGGGLWLSFLRKLGLGPAYPPCAGPVAFGVSAASSASAGWGVLETIIGSDAGLVALLIAGTSAAVAIGVVGHHAFTQPPAMVEASAGPWALFPMRSRQSSAPAAAPSPDGASSSLEYMAQAARQDAWLRERAGVAQAEGAASSPSLRDSASSVPEAPRSQAGDGAANASGASARTLLARAPGLGGQSGGISMGGAGGLRDALSGKLPGAAQKVYGIAPQPRSRASAVDGRRSLLGNRGARTSDALRFANRDGLSQKGAKNPLMTAAGYTFDGAASAIQGSPAGAPTGGDTMGGVVGPRDRFSPDKVIDQKDIPQPVPPTADTNKTPYQWAMWVAIGGLLAAMLLMKMAGAKKDAAKALVGPAQAAMLSAAAMLHWLAAAAAALAAAMGMIMMKSYEQKTQGMMFIGSGGLLSAYNIKSALDVKSGSAEGQAQEDKALGGMKAGADEAKGALGASDSPCSSGHCPFRH